MEQKEKKKERNTVNHFYGPIGQYIEHVEHNHFGMNRDGDMQMSNDATEVGKPLFSQLPSGEQMRRVVEATIRDGYWWGNRSWAVVYRVYQMKGYLKGIAQFVKEVEGWKIDTTYICNYDAVQKPIVQGKIVGPIDTWKANGVPESWIKLAEALLRGLE